MAVAHSAGLVESHAGEYAEIEAWYRDLLTEVPEPVAFRWEPVRIGPTWQRTAAGWLLPAASLGWGVMAWCGRWLTLKGAPWTFTAEQARFLLWYYAVDTGGDFTYHSAMLQRLKGWGKDPLAACVGAASLHAPVVFERWEGDRPVGRDEPDAWTQILAVNITQTQNTMKLFPGLIPAETRRRYGIQIGKENVWSDGDRRQIQAVTNSVLAIEGGRPKQVIRSEIQNWVSGNGGHDMAGALEGNAAKAEVGSPARILDIFNAFRPGRDSVAERARLAWDETHEDGGFDYGVLLDSLEAAPSAPLSAEAAPDVIRSVAGDASWLDIRPDGRILKSIMNPANSAAESRRKWYNQITGTEDAWAEPRWVDQCADRALTLADGERIVLFGDGSKSGDDTGLVACRLSDGALFVVHHQHPRADQLIVRADVAAAVVETFDRYKVSGFWFDPSHAKDDGSADDDRFWWPLVDRWAATYGKRLKLWPVKSGPGRHAVAFDMTKDSAQKLFQPAVSQLADDLETGVVRHVGGRLSGHMKNARRREGKFGLAVGKESRRSPRKIDLAVCAIGARMMRRQLQIDGKTHGTPGRGRVLALD